MPLATCFLQMAELDVGRHVLHLEMLGRQVQKQGLDGAYRQPHPGAAHPPEDFPCGQGPDTPGLESGVVTRGITLCSLLRPPAGEEEEDGGEA